ncbi:hypothetical protein [Rhizobium lentis]|uniref:Uncharacterized protein n=1 Tax=Rhizobium lentis TaxID=1138194 RepID=A0ABS7ID36_9HYPH|nr:hypothetical protein [Rhizobium lentis]MBX5041132.1 hypothetical protein [Rhizobium lentis]MBX5051861.1 hypothetical protein [Rhizobium lentis]MBX5071419.1 hypothetical protein [Rhizobium lentis]MBX5088503.1 hypothetical protein [Rhizobium lentis]MBX5105887.1 hypothetical protein [Rhizobium lentis]
MTWIGSDLIAQTEHVIAPAMEDLSNAPCARPEMACAVTAQNNSWEQDGIDRGWSLGKQVGSVKMQFELPPRVVARHGRTRATAGIYHYLLPRLRDVR